MTVDSAVVSTIHRPVKYSASYARQDGSLPGDRGDASATSGAAHRCQPGGPGLHPTARTHSLQRPPTPKIGSPPYGGNVPPLNGQSARAVPHPAAAKGSP